VKAVVGHQSHDAAVDARKSRHELRSILGAQFKEGILIHDAVDETVDVEGFVGVLRNKGVQVGHDSGRPSLVSWGFLLKVVGKVRKKPPNEVRRVLLVFGNQVA
jgi:hypothetical protein